MQAESGTRLGRPRSETARTAVLEAVDDLLVDEGYAAMTMTSIAERAGVGRPTVYRWWSTKAEILLEACLQDAAQDLELRMTADVVRDLRTYLRILADFLTRQPAGLGYRALVGEAQHDPVVADLLRAHDVLGPPTLAVLDRHHDALPGRPGPRLAVAQLIGPTLSRVLLTGTRPPRADITAHVALLVEGWSR